MATNPETLIPPVRCAHTEMRDVAALVENPRNPNRHGQEQLRLLAKIIAATGWRAPVVVSKRSGFVVKGHGRLQAARAAGWERVPVDVQDYADEATEWADMIADNRLAELAEMDAPALKDLLQELDTGALDMELAGYAENALAELMGAVAPLTDADVPEAKIDKADELKRKWKTKLGQLWQLGKHRLLCGDCRDEKNVETLMGGGYAHLLVTDQPYGVEYDANWRCAAGLCGPTAATGKVANDDITDWSSAWKLFGGDVIYVWHADKFVAEAQASLHACGFQVRCQIIWAKSSFCIGRGDYHWQHEPCFYAVRKGKTGHWNGDRTQSTLWQIDKPHKSETGHSTQKPIECMARPIVNNSVEGDGIYEPFLGSGTTLIACEKLNRICYAMEIEPKYVAVAIERWHEMTGLEPRLISE